jgi:2,3-bisphosphoglycerate-independent phosphoglycerate mutase
MQALADELPGASMATVTGRYYAMDRDQRWDRVQRAFQALVHAEGLPAGTAAEALEQAYGRDEDDEFVQPTVLTGYPGVAAGDAFLFINFRADRARELTAAFVAPGFDGFDRELPRLSGFATFTEYQANLPAAVAFPTETLPDLFGQVIAEAGLTQLRIAETEKYAHVTFFFNGGEEEPYPGEERILVPSPRVATYDLQPEMSAPEVGDRLAEAIRSGRFDVIICNMANPDMVGHTGSLPAAIKAVQAVDEALGKVCKALDETGGELLVTADHGNVEQMTDPASGQAHTAHTTNPVPLVFRGRAGQLADGGSLRDLAPTMLSLLGLPQPKLMTGKPLVTVEQQTRSVA